MSFGTFFFPGPTEVRPAVLQAMAQPMIPHRHPRFEHMFENVQYGLREVFETDRPVYISTSSATGLMEAGVRCAPVGRVLALVNGAFSERFVAIAQACGRDVDRYEVEWGAVHQLDRIEAYLTKTAYALVTVVHSETSTGALNDVRAIQDIARRYGAMCVVDSVSGVGGTELRFDAWSFDYVLTASQKALALPPGLAFAVASPEFIERATGVADRGLYFDLVRFDAYAYKHQTPGTPALPLYYALAYQLADIHAEGLANRWARHSAMAQRTWQWVDEVREMEGIELRVLAPAGARSPTVTVLTLPPGLQASVVVQAVADRGFTIAEGYGKFSDSTVRIGHMGDHTLDGLNRCLDECAAVLHELTY